MAQGTSIEWTAIPGYTPRTWNPLAGCTRKSEGCDSCYAAGMAIRLEGMAHADIAAGKDPGGKAKYIGCPLLSRMMQPIHGGECEV